MESRKIDLIGRCISQCQTLVMSFNFVLLNLILASKVRFVLSKLLWTSSFNIWWVQPLLSSTEENTSAIFSSKSWKLCFESQLWHQSHSYIFNVLLLLVFFHPCHNVHSSSTPHSPPGLALASPNLHTQNLMWGWIMTRQRSEWIKQWEWCGCDGTPRNRPLDL